LKRLFIFGFILLLAVHLLAGPLDYDAVRVITKPFLLILLIALFVVSAARSKFDRFAVFILLGLVFSLAGDVLLIPDDTDQFFIYGLGSFMLAHIFYIRAFTITYLENHEIALIKRHGWVMILIIAYGFSFFRLIQDHLHEMIGPVMLYTMVITLMLLLAANRYKRVGKKSFQYILFGAILFVLSDSILAWNMFVKDLEYSHLLIMSTYGLAQLFIVLGALEQVERNP
jgi:uncharacterized membrane protein YhhN